MAAVATSASALTVHGVPSRKHSASSSQPSTTDRMTSRKLFGRSRKPAPAPSELNSSTDSAGHSYDGYASSPYHSNYSSNARSDDHAEDKIFSSRLTNHSTSALSGISTASRTSRFFRRFARQKPPPVPSLPPALILDLDAGTALPRSSQAAYGMVSTQHSKFTMTSSSQPPTAAAAIIAESNAAYAAAESIPKPKGLQRKKMLDAVTNARLSVSQTRDLVRMCGVQIRERGLDTSGLFRPFRIAESRHHVYHMIQLFLLSIDITTYISVFPILPENALDRLSRDNTGAGQTSSQQAKSKIAREELDKELRYAAPHDVVSVMKWGLRHMRLRPSDFHSKDAEEWYDVFVAAERDSGYHARAIADLLHPKLPQATAELLSEVLDLIASVAAHASSNHMPASALCKILGFWLVGRIGVAHPPPTMDELIEAVNKASAMTEHLLLAHIRSQAAVTYSMPLRLTELVQRYPYIKAGAESPSLPPAFASRTVPTLRVDLRSDNLIVSQAKPRSPSSTLSDALEASASESISGGHGEVWAAVMMQIDHDTAEDGMRDRSKGHELLIDEHARILRQVDLETFQVHDEETSESDPKLPNIVAGSVNKEVKANRRRSQSLSDLRTIFGNNNRNTPAISNHILGPLVEASSSNGTNTPRNAGTPKRKPVPLLDAELLAESEAVEVVNEASKSSRHAGGSQRHEDLFSGELEPSTSWRSFSEEGFMGGIMSTASSDLSLTEFDTLPSSSSASNNKSGSIGGGGGRRANRSLYRGRSGSLRRGRQQLYSADGFSISSNGGGGEKKKKEKQHTVTLVKKDVPMDPSFAILWQDQLLDPSPCCKFPCSLVFVQLNSKTATVVEHACSSSSFSSSSSTSTTTGLEMEKAEQDYVVPKYPTETPWLLINESILPPRPSTPPAGSSGFHSTMRNARKNDGGWRYDPESGSEFDSSTAMLASDRKSIFAPSIKSVKMRLRRVSTVIGNGIRGKGQ